jgi:hypothetical protein
VPCSLPRWIDSVLSVGLLARSRAGLLPEPRGLPGTNGRSASTNFLSRPAQASLTLRPADLLAHLAWTLSRGSHPGRYPPSWLASYPGVPTPPGSGTLTHWWSAPLGRARSFRNFTLFGGSGLDRFKMRKPGLVYQQGRPVSVAATCNVLGVSGENISLTGYRSLSDSPAHGSKAQRVSWARPLRGHGLSDAGAFSVKLTDLSGLIRIPSLAMATARRRSAPAGPCAAPRY